MLSLQRPTCKWGTEVRARRDMTMEPDQVIEPLPDQVIKPMPDQVIKPLPDEVILPLAQERDTNIT